MGYIEPTGVCIQNIQTFTLYRLGTSTYGWTQLWVHPSFLAPSYLLNVSSTILDFYTYIVAFLAYPKGFKGTELKDFTFDGTEIHLRECVQDGCRIGCFMTPWCHNHLHELFGVGIWRSIISGAGAVLFAHRTFKRGEIRQDSSETSHECYGNMGGTPKPSACLGCRAKIYFSGIMAGNLQLPN